MDIGHRARPRPFKKGPFSPSNSRALLSGLDFFLTEITRCEKGRFIEQIMHDFQVFLTKSLKYLVYKIWCTLTRKSVHLYTISVYNIARQVCIRAAITPGVTTIHMYTSCVYQKLRVGGCFSGQKCGHARDQIGPFFSD